MQRANDRWLSVGLALLVHGALLAALMYGWMLFRAPPRPVPTLAIEASVVDARTLAGAATPAPPQPPPAAPVPAPSPPPAAPPEPQGPPPPTPEERAQREKQRAVEKQKIEAAVAQKASEEKAEAQAAQARVAEDARKAAERKRAEAAKQAGEAKAAQEKKAQEAALAAHKAEEAQEAAEREADLKRSLASEEHAASSAPALAKWQAQIAARIERAWIRPPTARPGIQCTLNVTQAPGGAVTQVTIGACNGDAAVRQSIEQAAYRASPLPPPPDPSLFERELTIHFTPD